VRFHSVFFSLGFLLFGALWSNASTSAVFFGMHETNPARNGWPSVGFKTLRSWNAYPSVSWRDINPSRGVYKWSNLDNLVNLASSHGTDVVYTFGRTPAWASSNPTGYCKNTYAGSCYPPASQQYWKDFVNAISARYAGKIKYWETWNEANATNSWAGTMTQMLTMAKSAYPIIKAHASAAVVISPGPQGPTAYRWLDDYLAAGGGAYANAFAFHGYVGYTNGVSNPPEKIVPLIANIKLVTSRHGQSSKPLWDTEHGWGPNTSLPNQDQQAAWLARHVILSWSSGISRSVWYLWDSNSQGTLWDRTNKIRKPGIAYGQVYKWLVGATKNLSCAAGSNSVWSCTFTRPDGQMGEITWKSSGSATSQIVPGQYTHYRDVAGNRVTVPASRSVSIGSKPIVLLTPGTL
jgi:hypothetical protein